MNEYKKQKEQVVKDMNDTSGEWAVLFVMWIAIVLVANLVSLSALAYWMTLRINEYAPHIDIVKVSLAVSGVAFPILVFNVAIQFFALVLYSRLSRNITDGENWS